LAISASEVERALNVPLDRRETTRSPGDIESVSMTPSASRSPIPWYSVSASRFVNGMTAMEACNAEV
jgi:hypothetical protein